MKCSRILLSFILILVVGLSIAPVAADGHCPQDGGTFTIGITDILPLDPDTAASDWTFYIITNIHSMLFRIESGQPVGGPGGILGYYRGRHGLHLASPQRHDVARWQ